LRVSVGEFRREFGQLHNRNPLVVLISALSVVIVVFSRSLCDVVSFERIPVSLQPKSAC